MRTFLPPTIVILLIAVVARVEFALALGVLIGVVILIGSLVPARIERHLEVERRFVDRAFWGEKVAVEVTVRNRSLFPATWVELRESVPYAIAPQYEPIKRVMSVPARDERRFTYEVHGRRRGYYLLGPTSVKTGDALGVSTRHTTALRSRPLIVYPKILPLERLGLPTHSPLVDLAARMSLFSDPNRVGGVTDYQHGDSIRRIHWSASARTGGLLVKQLDPAEARETMLVLDMDRRDYQPGSRVAGPELAITVAASLAVHMMTRERQPTGLATRAVDPVLRRVASIVLPAGSERARLLGVLEYLARVQTATELGFADFLSREAARFSFGSSVVAISGSLRPSLAQALVGLRKAGHPVMVILVRADKTQPGAEAWLETQGISISRIDEEKQLGAT